MFRKYIKKCVLLDIVKNFGTPGDKEKLGFENSEEKKSLNLCEYKKIPGYSSYFIKDMESPLINKNFKIV